MGAAKRIDKDMKNVGEHDERQLKLMHETLTAFENGQMVLTSLVGTLEFLLIALESVNQDWEENFLNEITTIETINSLGRVVN